MVGALGSTPVPGRLVGAARWVVDEGPRRRRPRAVLADAARRRRGPGRRQAHRVTLLIDPPNSPGHGRLWSHLASDRSYDELHAFAQSLGIPQRGFDRDHYDIPAERYDVVVAAGAVPVTSRELIARLKAAGLRRRKAETLAPKRPGRPLIRAPRLRAGDIVAVVAPAGPVAEDRLDAGLAVLESWGLDVRVMERVRGTDRRFGYLAADDAARAGDLMRAWCDAGVRAVFAARGGGGGQRGGGPPPLGLLAGGGAQGGARLSGPAARPPTRPAGPRRCP